MAIAEFQPDWSKAPKWAKWWTMDENGACMWHQEEPEIERNHFWIAEGKNKSSIEQCVDINWRTSKRRRPACSAPSDAQDGQGDDSLVGGKNERFE